MSEWAEMRHLHEAQGVAKKEIARRFGRDVKTVRRAVARETPPLVRKAMERPRRLDAERARIEAWIAADPKISSKRVWVLLGDAGVASSQRGVRRYLARLRQRPREAFVHRTPEAGDAMEVDFGQTRSVVAGVEYRHFLLVATLPASNTYFARAYRVERLESLLDGIVAAFVYFGGLTRRLVLDNTSIAVKRVLTGREREETDAFHGFRGALGVGVDYCAPGKGWEKGSVERGVRYVRDLFFRPMPHAGSFDEVNAQLLAEIERDLDRRRMADGRTAREALAEERSRLRPLPGRLPEPCRTLAKVADRYGHVHHEAVRYSVPIALAYRDVLLKVFAARIEVAAGVSVVARHDRSFEGGAYVLDPLHVLPLLEWKSRAAPEATALRSLPAVFGELRQGLLGRTKHPEREWVQVLRLAEIHGIEALGAAVSSAIARGSPRLETVRAILRPAELGGAVAAAPVTREDLARVVVAQADLSRYETLLEVVR
jgi:transposase